jgi:hypothetical protein
MPSLNSQVGLPLVSRNAPEFEGYQVVANTWKPKNLLVAKDTKGTNSASFNVNFYGPGTEADCELVQFITDPPTADLETSQVISEVEGPDQTDGLLIKGNYYKITNSVGGDDFTNVGAPDNNDGTVFKATGTTPSVWTNGSVLNEAPLWLVMKADPIGFDEPPLHFQVTLKKSPDLNLLKTTPVT